MKDVFIVASKRTPTGSFLGSLSRYTATQLGEIAIKAAIESISLDVESIDSVYLGSVLTAGLGQSPARQAAIFAGIPYSKDATTINKVCAAGMKATVLGAQQIQLGLNDVVITGGMESMSNVPHYVNTRKGYKLGNMTLVDGMVKDGLWDVYHDFHMGNAAEIGAREYKLSREAQDEYALQSYQKAQEATKVGKFADEIVPITIREKSGDIVLDYDEDIYKVIPEKMALLKPTFEEGGTHTAANSSNLNDGAAALILASAETVEKYGLKPLAKIIGYADAAQAPEWFTTSPSVAIPKALKLAGIKQSEVDYFEINEAYASVILSNQQILDLDLSKVNVYGGAVAIGHPIGASGARIVNTLLSVLKQEGGKYGVAAICNGGGGASAMVIESLNS